MQGSLGRAAVSCVVITWHISSSVCITAVIPGHQCNLSPSLIFTAWKGSTSKVQLLQYYNSANWTRIKNIPKVTQRRATKESKPSSVRHHSMGSVLSPVETKTGLLHQMNSEQFSGFPESGGGGEADPMILKHPPFSPDTCLGSLIPGVWGEPVVWAWVGLRFNLKLHLFKNSFIMVLMT